MPPLRIAVQLSNLRLPFRKALPWAARLGARAVELDARGELNPQELSGTALRQVRKLLDDHGLSVSAVEFRTRRGYNVADELSRRVEATKAAMRFAFSLGTPLVVNQMGRIPPDESCAEWKLLVEVLSELGNFGQHVGAVLAAETGAESGADLRRLIDALPPGALAVTLNPGNLIVNGFAPLDAIAALGHDIQYVHAKDGVRDLAQGRGSEVTLGRGSADFPAVLGALEERNYRGYWCVECPRAHDPAGEISQAIQYLNQL